NTKSRADRCWKAAIRQPPCTDRGGCVDLEQLAAEFARHGYAVRSRLGQGSTSQVLEAEQNSTRQTVALKGIGFDTRLDDVRREKMAARFERETHICAQLHHTHIVRLLDKGVLSDTRWFAAFEYVPGMTLADLLARDGPLDPPMAQELMLQILDALA